MNLRKLKPKKLRLILVLAFVLSILAGVNGAFAGVSSQQAINFLPAMNFPVGDGPSGITEADFNNDGKIDLATVNVNDNTISVLQGDGAGNFGPATAFPVGVAPEGITAADFDKDGNVDLATSNLFGNNVSVLLGNGTGNFGPAVNFAVGDEPSGITAADFNLDGSPIWRQQTLPAIISLSCCRKYTGIIISRETIAAR